MKCLHAELPEFKRCCFCIPLRFGLLTLGYMKLAIAVLLLYPVTVTLIMLYMFGFFHHIRFIMDVIEILVLAAVLLLDICFNITFIVAAHTKNHKIMIYYNRYALFVLISTTLLFVYLAGLFFYKYQNSPYNDTKKIFNLIASFGSCHFLLQFYLILLIRSEIKKLSDNSSFRFVNNAADAQCIFVSPDMDPQETEDMKKVEEIN